MVDGQIVSQQTSWSISVEFRADTSGELSTHESGIESVAIPSDKSSTTETEIEVVSKTIYCIRSARRGPYKARRSSKEGQLVNASICNTFSCTKRRVRKHLKAILPTTTRAHIEGTISCAIYTTSVLWIQSAFSCTNKRLRI